MQLMRGMLYKIIEIDQGIALVNALDRITDRADAVELVTAELETCMDYLVRYTHARSCGRTIKRAHWSALYGLKTLNHWRPE
jgi:hypothetical protein